MRKTVLIFGALLFITTVFGVNNTTDVIVEFAGNTTANISIDQIVIFNTTLFNNGSANATNYFLNLSLWSGPGLDSYKADLGLIVFNLSANERNNFTKSFQLSYLNSPFWNYTGGFKGGKYYTFDANVTDGINTNLSLSNNRSAFKLAYSSWGGGNFFDYTYQYRVKYANGTELIVRNTSELIAGGRDYISINYYGNVNYLVLEFKLNATKADSLISQGKTLKVVKYNGTTGNWENMSVGSNGITFLDIDLIKRLITINTSSFSDWGFLIVDVPPPPTPAPAPQSSGGGGGYVPKLTAIKDYRPFIFSDCIVIYGKNSREIDAVLAKKVKEYLYCDRVVREDEEYDWKKYDRDNKNIILIGGIHANEMVKGLNDNYSFTDYIFEKEDKWWSIWNGKEFILSDVSTSYYFSRFIKSTIIKSATLDVIAIVPSNAVTIQDNQNAYMIQILNHPVRTSKKVMVLAGLTSRGTEEAVRVITNSSEYGKLVELNYLGGRN